MTKVRARFSLNLSWKDVLTVYLWTSGGQYTQRDAVKVSYHLGIYVQRSETVIIEAHTTEYEALS